jgi:hypothetical protein
MNSVQSPSLNPAPHPAIVETQGAKLFDRHDAMLLSREPVDESLGFRPTGRFRSI